MTDATLSDSPDKIRHPFRPGHVHFRITAPGFQPLVTHIFDEGGEYLDSDTVFAVKDSLKVPFEERQTAEITRRYRTGEDTELVQPDTEPTGCLGGRRLWLPQWSPLDG